MDEHFIKIHKWLYPVSWIYGAVVTVRNKLFDWGFLRSKSFGVPVICIGNLSVGGTGKTPHTEYLIKLLRDNYHVAVLSRGYKRHSRGYVLATPQSTARSIGDEPYQMHTKFPSVTLAVDENRCHGIEQLLSIKEPSIEVVLLDDAFQHRYVKPGLSILLTDYHRLFCDDTLLPAGRLRESVNGKNRAQIVIVTKCPQDIKPIDYNIITKRLNLYPYQQLYFSFDDHHHFSHRDIQQIKERFGKLKGEHKLIVTTEKDATRLIHHPALSEELKPFIYALPIEIEILQNQQDKFNQHIIGYVRENTRNSSFSERENAHQS